MASVNLLRGRPGAGKGYEGVAFHIIPAIKEGRKVITNMQLQIEHFCAVFGEQCRDLIECRPDKVKLENQPGKVNFASYRWQFSRVEDFETDWRHPETGQGPLFVIDECHKAFRKGDDLREVEEWFAEVRHTGANVLLMTQGTRKVNPNIMDLVQLTYLCSKVPGDEGSYYRKVIDGLRGEAMNTTTRQYESWVYPFYKSHTKSDTSVQEALNKDVKSINSHWIFKVTKLVLVIGIVGLVYVGYQVFGSDSDPEVKPKASTVAAKQQHQSLASQFDSLPERTPEPVRVSVAPSGPVLDGPSPEPVEAVVVLPEHPYSAFNITIMGTASKTGENPSYVLSFAQNGQKAFHLLSHYVEENGYDIEPMGPCLAKLTFGEQSQFITCGFHKMSVSTPMSSS